jgi:hypothetical protein
MKALRRVVFVVVTVMAAGIGAGCRPGADSDCPDGLKLVRERSSAGKAIWCKSADGTTSRWIQYHDGKPPTKARQSCPYKAGKVDGTVYLWHATGKPWIEGTYEAGNKAGVWTQWHADGTKVAEGMYRNGKLVAGAPVAMAALCETMKP